MIWYCRKHRLYEEKGPYDDLKMNNANDNVYCTVIDWLIKVLSNGVAIKNKKNMFDFWLTCVFKCTLKLNILTKGSYSSNMCDGLLLTHFADATILLIIKTE